MITMKIKNINQVVNQIKQFGRDVQHQVNEMNAKRDAFAQKHLAQHGYSFQSHQEYEQFLKERGHVVTSGTGRKLYTDYGTPGAKLVCEWTEPFNQ